MTQLLNYVNLSAEIFNQLICKKLLSSLARPCTLFTFFLVLVFAGLGTWQLERKEEKEALLYALSQAWVGDIHDVDETHSPTPMKPLSTMGYYLPDKRIFLQSKTHQGKSGVYVLDVFQTQGGKFVLVQRGWAPQEHTSPSTGTIKIEGIVRIPSTPGYFQPVNKPGSYFWIDLKALSQDLQVALLPYYLVVKNPQEPGIIATEPYPMPRNNHLEYAITWYSLAFALLVMLLLAIKRKKHDCTNHNT